ncbi:hypothetical protein WH47_07333 [Habropoda laboriosa]|uniref:TOG domain-containing protein n=1 Tax=Habropoda laboriosa TaxID=597456 RepID=A0A0L7R615_9HYME|nr:hypothetical protein WH47_07333 [Habropoda laboriosa]
MSECLDIPSSMTGSTNSGPLQPQKDSSPLPARSSPFNLYSTPESPTRRGHRQRLFRKMTLTSANGQPIQLTPLWEHVVRTRRFPTEVDTRLTFLEISERLRDPEWEVRQHALRVLIDVLPTLNTDIVDKVMQPVVPELVNNLGHPAPAVRKGALDAIRVFLIHSHDKENTIKNILQDGLNRSEIRDSFQTNVTTGVILSVPSLLFPSSSSPSPNPQLIKEATIALASRLAQVPHQEAVLKSLMKIRDSVGVEDFQGYLEDYDNKLNRNIEILSKIYNVRSNRKSPKKLVADVKNVEKTENKNLDKKSDWESDSDTSGIVEEEDEVNTATMPAARVVLETEIKFNEETAITMTILEEKEDSEQEQEDEESGAEVKNEAEGKDISLDRRKTPRRVHFGGEIVKLRTPDSDDTESVEAVPKTRIPVPVSPATKMPNTRPRPSSQPCSPHREPGKLKRGSRSVSNSPKREVYMHHADLSPKKSILTRTSSPLLSNKAVEHSKKKKNVNRIEDKDNRQSIMTIGDNKSVKIIEIAGKVEESRKEEVKLDQAAQDLDSLNSNLNVNGSEDLEDKGLKKMVEQGESKNSQKIDKHSESKKVASLEDTASKSDGRIEFEDKERKNDSENRTSGNVQSGSVENVQQSDSFGDSMVKGNKLGQSGVKANQDGVKVVENETVQKDSGKLKSGVTSGSRNDNGDRESFRNDCERTSRSDRDKGSASVIEKNGNAAYASGEMESILHEPSWEELGLVDQEVLEDLHNKVSVLKELFL